jgi:processive 1,2-diacylglycerol beta-glucosyltransferase
MKKNHKILILYASYGNGHYQVSRALQQGFSDQGYENVKIIDLFEEAHPWINALTRYIYNKSFFVASFFLYGWTYYCTQNMNNKTVWSRWFHSFGAGKLQEILKSEKPDVVIHTFPMQVLSELRKSKGICIPSATVLTDFCLHNRWLHTEIDRYYVPTEDLMEELLVKGIPPQKIRVSGIPIMKEFSDSLSITPSYEPLGLNRNKKMCLIMANSYSTSLLQEICRPFLSNTQVDIVLICGRNSVLKKVVKAYFKDYTNIHVIGYVDHVHQLMRIASCIITKAGGITLSEALAVNLPILIFRPLPGQEKENARYLSEKGAALTVYHTEELVDAISQILSDEIILHQMRKGMKALQKPDATHAIVRDILHHFTIEPKCILKKDETADK